MNTTTKTPTKLVICKCPKENGLQPDGKMLKKSRLYLVFRIVIIE